MLDFEQWNQDFTPTCQHCWREALHAFLVGGTGAFVLAWPTLGLALHQNPTLPLTMAAGTLKLLLLGSSNWVMYMYFGGDLVSLSSTWVAEHCLQETRNDPGRGALFEPSENLMSPAHESLAVLCENTHRVGLREHIRHLVVGQDVLDGHFTSRNGC